MSYVYSCINPFALYFLSTTFRHFYKRYLFFWTHKSCCCAQGHSDHQKTGRRAAEMTLTEYPRNSSVNNVATVYYDLNRTKSASFHQQRHSPTKLDQSKSADGQLLRNGSESNNKSGKSLVPKASS